MESRVSWVGVGILLLAGLFVCNLLPIAEAEGFEQSWRRLPTRGALSAGLDLAPANPLALPGSSGPRASGSSSLYLSDGLVRQLLPLIPNLQFGYLYSFGNDRVSQGRFTGDYLLPVNLSADSILFGEAHTEFQHFWKTESYNSRIDVSLGGGYRTLMGRDAMLGVNAFFDTSRLWGTWHSSGGIGFEMAALVAGGDAVDLNFNWYGKLFDSSVILNAFRYGPSNYDLEAGYSHELWNGGPDLRVKMTGYQFDVGNKVYGWNAGAELKSRDGVFVLRYEVGHDKVNRTYQTVGGFVNVGFQPENLLSGESPFTMPEPIFKSPRTLRYALTRKVKRNWHQSTAAVMARKAGSAAGGGPDRFLESVPMGDGETHQSFMNGWPIIPFEPVPYSELDPAKFITVELSYEFDQAPTGGTADWNIMVCVSSNWVPVNFIQVNRPADKSGHIEFLLENGQPDSPQSAFTSTGVDPSGILIQVGAPGTSTMTITDLTIHFNM